MQGQLRKMLTQLADPVEYWLPLSDQRVPLNPLLGQTITLHYTGEISCIHCGRKTKKSFNQGYCYHLGTCREPAWGEEHCLQPHYVYLANSSGIKVGITRHTQIPTRWMDQGAVQALPIIRVASRLISGLVEKVIANHVSDKTSWQRMLKNQVEPIDLAQKRDLLLADCAEELSQIEKRFADGSIEYLNDAEAVNITYPVGEYPSKVKSLNFDKHAEVIGVLLGIKGQYLMLDTGVINIRKFGGYEIAFEA
jgi:hypothetical protein